MYDFTGRTILVTGAAGGIGGETVRRLRACGADVLASSKTVDSLGPIADETGAMPLAFDLESEQSIESALNGLVVDGVVNCGGWGGEIATPMDTNVEVFDSVIRINARGTLLVTKHAARAMVAAKRPGAIVNVSSQASLVALPGHISYAASKAAVDSITRVAALELGPFGIRVNAVNPTVVMTPMSAGYWAQDEIAQPFLAAMPLGRYATEREIADPIIFLLSDAASMITGATLPVDGGYTCR